MELHTTIRGARYRLDRDSAVSIAIRQTFDDNQPNLFGVPRASATPVEQGDFVGDTSRGGSCNVHVVRLNPHCNGTHTESVAHIVNDKVAVGDLIDSVVVFAELISITPAALGESGEDYPGGKEEDLVVTAGDIQRSLQSLGDGADRTSARAIVIRTRPNAPQKRFANYDSEPVPPYLTTNAVETINRMSATHLLVDLPSIDRVFDNGQLANHHAYWQVQPGSRRLSPASCTDKTITEFVFVPDEVRDGFYALDLQVVDFELDAVPSRPMLIPLIPAGP